MPTSPRRGSLLIGQGVLPQGGRLLSKGKTNDSVTRLPDRADGALAKL